MKIQFHIPNEDIQEIKVNIKDLVGITNDIASFCQGAQLANWTDSVVDEVMAYIWFGIEVPYKEPYISPDSSEKELSDLLISIKRESERLGWYVYNDDSMGYTFVSLRNALEEFKVEDYFKV